MPTDIANFLATNSPRFNRAAQDTAHSNALINRNAAARIPQANRAQDLAIQGDEQTLNMRGQQMTEAQRTSAAGVLARNFTIAANSPRPRDAAKSLIASPEFQSAGRLIGLPIDQFTVTDQDTDDTIRQQLQTWGQALTGGSSQRRVQSTHVLDDGTIAIVEADGTIRRTNEKARNDLRFVDYGGGTGAFDPRQGTVAPITSATQETAAAADRAGAEAWAKAAATAGVDLQKEQVGKQGTLGVWQVAREGLLRGLAGTSTGPVQGLFPAITANQQIAEGAIAAVAPVLKQLFRSAGEGVFTDRDQQLLLDMTPKRTDHPETVASKMQMIDAIIEAKLAAPTSIPSPSRPGEQPTPAPTTAQPNGIDWRDLR